MSKDPEVIVRARLAPGEDISELDVSLIRRYDLMRELQAAGEPEELLESIDARLDVDGRVIHGECVYLVRRVPLPKRAKGKI